jgi:hypothetical protein
MGHKIFKKKGQGQDTVNIIWTKMLLKSKNGINKMTL